jgi:hypothetical protein
MDMLNTIASLLIGLGSFGAFVVGVLTVLKGRQNGGKLDEAASHLAEIHVMVNSQLTAALLRVDQLVTSMQQANVEIPLPIPKDPDVPPIKIIPVPIGTTVEPMLVVAPKETAS